MALSASKDANERGMGRVVEEVLSIATGSTIHGGSLVNQLTGATGRAVAASAATGRRFVGLAVAFYGANADGVGVTDGSEKVRVRYGHEVEVNVETSLRTNTTLGLNVFISDDETVAGVGVGTAGLRIVPGKLLHWVDQTGADKSKAWVAMLSFAKADIAV